MKIYCFMRYMLGVLLIVFILTQGMPGQDQDPCEKFKNRPGNDDIVIMVDTSLSMVRLIDDIRDQLKGFFRCYIKKGDFVILGTFDSTCQIQFSMELLKYDRDFPLLLSQVDSLTPRRKIYYEKENGRWEETDEPTSRVGGGQFTNLGEMIKKVSEVLKQYQTPGNRKFLLIYTDAINDPPAYIGERRVELKDFFRDIKTQNIKLGLVACDEESFDRLQQLIQVIDESGEWQKSKTVGVMRNPQTIISPDILGSDVLTESPVRLTLGRVWTPVIDTDIVFYNELGIDATIKIEQIRLEIINPSGEKSDIPLVETPKNLTIKAQEKISLPIKKELPRGMRGKYTGDIVFDITSAVRALPHHIPIEYIQSSYCETHKGICIIGTILAGGIILFVIGFTIRILYLKLKPQWVIAYFRNKKEIDSSKSQKITRGGELRVVGKTQTVTEQTLNLQRYMGNDIIATLKRKRIAAYELTDTHDTKRKYRLNEVVTMYREPGGFWSLIPIGDPKNIEKATLQIPTSTQPLIQRDTFFKFDRNAKKDDTHEEEKEEKKGGNSNV